MKQIRAIIQPHKLETVREALGKIGVQGLTVYEARGYGRQRGHQEIYRGAEYTVDFRPKMTIDLVVEDDRVDAAIDAVIETARSGNVGDGKIFVSTIDEVVRIRTGERNESAL